MYTKVQIAWWRRCDSAEVFAIERLNHGVNAESEKYFLDMLQEPTIIGCVAHKAGEVVAFMMYELLPSSLDILHLEIHPQWGKCGIEAQMLNNLRDKCLDKGRSHISYAVREGNLALQVYLKQEGWKCTGVKRDFFPKTYESAYIFKFLVEKPANTQTNAELLELE